MPVESIEYLIHTEDTYDITVNNNHNFFIKLPHSTILVHNCKEFLSEHILGPVTSKVVPDQVIPKVFLHESGIRAPYKYKTWVSAMQFLARDKKRMKMIAELAVSEVKLGHFVLIPITFVKHANELTEMIDKMLYKLYDKKNLAVAFTSRVKDRKDILDKIKRGKILVTVGMRSLIQAGINIPRWSSLIEICPISNRPNFQQETARIRTPAPELNKPQPRIHMVIDQDLGGMSTGCFATCFQDLKDFEWDPDSMKEALAVLKGLNKFRREEGYDVDALKPQRLVGFDEPKKERGSGFGSLNTNSRR